jgi:uncharacterized membrane protein YqgA involved in biofilm formation
MTTIGFAVLIIGISGALKGENALVLILSAVLGTAIGTLLDLDGKLERLGGVIARKWGSRGKIAASSDENGKEPHLSPADGTLTVRGEGGAPNIAEGFVTGALLFCIGAMTIVGSLEAGLRGDNSMIFTKSLLDLISSCVLAASLGVGVMFAGGFVLVFQGAIVLLAGLIAPVLSPSAINEMTCVGSLMIIALAFNLIGVGKFVAASTGSERFERFKVTNILPAIVLAPLFSWLLRGIG